MPMRCSWPPENEAGRRSPRTAFDADPLQQLVGASAALATVVKTVDDPRLGHDVARMEAWIDRREGVLVDQLQVPPHLSERVALERQEVLTAERDGARVGLDQAQQDAPDGGLARARLAYQSMRLGSGHAEVHVLHRRHHTATRATPSHERLAQAARIEQWFSHGATVTGLHTGAAVSRR